MEVDPTETDRDNPFEPTDPGDDDEGEMIPYDIYIEKR